MLSTDGARRLLLAAALLCHAVAAAPSRAQQSGQPQQQTPAEEEEVVRITSDLVQTDVSVFDKGGRFVEGLRREDFELYLDGKPQPVTFFEDVSAGSPDEAAKLKAARASSSGGASAERVVAAAAASGPGRTIVFFVDDYHLAPNNVARTRQSLLRFVEQGMGPNDQAAITSASGQLGILQHRTDNKTVLRAGIERLKHVAFSARDGDRPPMSEYLASLVDRGDREVIGAFVQQFLKDNPGMSARIAETIIRNRARNIIQQSDAINKNVLLALTSVVRASASAPGRKLLFFVSDGLVLSYGDSEFTDLLRRITDAAARSGVVIYSMDARGLTNASWVDASQPGLIDTTGAIMRATTSEVAATQEPLRTLAADTGGRALLNSNSFDEGIGKGLAETSRYYLLAWQPEGGEGRREKFRSLQVKIAGRPELKVLVRGGFLRAAAAREGGKAKAAAPPKPGEELARAIRAPGLRTELPVFLALGYEWAPAGGTRVNASVQLDEQALDYGAEGARRGAVAEVFVAAFDTQGKSVGSFNRRLTVPPGAPGEGARHVAFTEQFPLPPGLYQVRVAARDDGSGLVGSTAEWVEVPDIRPGRFATSSLYLAERAAGQAASGATLVSADRRFARTSRLRLMTYIYNASQGAAQPDVAVRIEVLRDGKAVVTTPEQKVSPPKSPPPAAGIPYAADINLGSLSAGRYTLQVTVTDRATGASSTQRAGFTVM